MKNSPRSIARKTAMYGICTALCMILGYIEHLVPFPVGIYGIKLGLANLGIITSVYLLGTFPAVMINTLRIILSALLFGNAVSFVYSLCGGLLATAVMLIFKRCAKFSPVGISTLGGIAHNTAQLFVAVFMVDSLKLAFYLPVLLAAGALTGFVIGTASLPIINNKQLLQLCSTQDHTKNTTKKGEGLMVTEGMKAPDFTLQDKDGRSVSLSDFKGKTVVLYFYPKDNTPGCTRQACAFAGAYSGFKSKNVEVIGVSRDSVASHVKFAQKYELPFILLSDPELKAIGAYGVWQEKKLYGKVSMGVVRTTFIIDENGIVKKVMNKVKPDTNAAEILSEL